MRFSSIPFLSWMQLSLAILLTTVTATAECSKWSGKDVERHPTFCQRFRKRHENCLEMRQRLAGNVESHTCFRGRTLNVLGATRGGTYITRNRADNIEVQENGADDTSSNTRNSKVQTIVAIGSLDISTSNGAKFCPHPSIIMIVDDLDGSEGVIVDEAVIRGYQTQGYDDGPNNFHSKKFSNAEYDQLTNTTIESLAVLCDAIVVRIHDENKNKNDLSPRLVACLLRGNNRRKQAGMAEIKLWIEKTKGRESNVQRLTLGKDAGILDNRCHTDTTMWSVLFSSSNRNKEATFSNCLGRGSIQKTMKAIFRQISQSLLPSTLNSVDLTEIETKFPLCTISVEFLSQKRSLFPKGDETSRRNYQAKRDDTGENVRRIFSTAIRRLEDLELKMQTLLLDQSSNQMPLLEFGSLAQSILDDTETRLRDQAKVPDSFDCNLMKEVVKEIQRLYHDQLLALRNYYGRRYESILNEEVEHEKNHNETTDLKWAAGAKHMTQGFLAAAKNAVPAMYRDSSKSWNAKWYDENESFSFDHVEALQGLVRDMMDATERRKDELDAEGLIKGEYGDEGTVDGQSVSTQKHRLELIPTWLRRIAAKAFVFGVNYIQGWFAWQGIKKAAMERDCSQPKFPLF